MLEIRNLSKQYGGFRVVTDCSLTVAREEIVGLIGPNGAGKTTLFNLVTGSVPADSGEVLLDGREIRGRSTDAIARAGLVRTFQVPQLFSELSVLENLLVASPAQLGERFASVWFKPSRVAREERENEQKAWAMLGTLGMTKVANDVASSLSGGQRKLLELGRALMTRPQILLLDEPVAGVNPVLINQIGDLIRTLRSEGQTFLIIEHRMDFILGLSDRLYVMAEGSVLKQGTAEEIVADRDVLDAYLGVA